MPSFSRKSQAILDTVDPDLRKLFNNVVLGFDCTPTCGLRTEEEQAALYAIGRTTNIGQRTVTTLDGVNKKSKHQSGLALDICPYPIKWDDINRFYFFAGYVKRTAEDLGIKVRWGGDWDGDTEVSDQKFMDLPHWELIR
jgi:peptidoglycan L-alanyl-D-glutamate endopeptidase CwlK